MRKLKKLRLIRSQPRSFCRKPDAPLFKLHSLLLSAFYLTLNRAYILQPGHVARLINDLNQADATRLPFDNDTFSHLHFESVKTHIGNAGPWAHFKLTPSAHHSLNETEHAYVIHFTNLDLQRHLHVATYCHYPSLKWPLR